MSILPLSKAGSGLKANKQNVGSRLRGGEKSSCEPSMFKSQMPCKWLFFESVGKGAH